MNFICYYVLDTYFIYGLLLLYIMTYGIFLSEV